MPHSPVQLLWTGGWDSTFRLLQLLLVERRIVQPHHVITMQRPSFGAELRTMARIKESLFEAHRVSHDQLQPTQFRDAGDLRPDAETAGQMQSLKAAAYIGRQYEYLARYARQMDIDGLELSVHRDDRAYLFLRQEVQRVAAPDGTSYHTLVAEPSDPNLQLFRSFRLPLFEMTKLDMERMAAEHGFSEVMEQTWFCHKPLPGDVPCGRCRPCGYAVTEGMARRLPWKSRFHYHIRQARKRLKM